MRPGDYDSLTHVVYPATLQQTNKQFDTPPPVPYSGLSPPSRRLESRLMPSFPCPGPLSRRQFLKLGALSLGAGLGGVVPYQLASENGRPASDTAVIFIWLPGGPPHMETYDL